jgi:tetratricopeptide (TPR) repeat protein
MAESPAERTARLLAEGLDAFGRDDIDGAVASWREALALDPSNREARDYLESAGVSVRPASDRAATARALALAEKGDAEQALVLLQGAVERTPGDLEAQAALDLVRAQLFVACRAQVGSLDARPRLKVRPDQLSRFDLPPEAGFLVSLLDGRTRIDQLTSAGGLDAFEVLHLLARLARAGIVEIAR